MYPQTHFLFSYLVGLIFAKFGVIDYKSALFVGLVGLLVDIDHYVLFLMRYKFKDFSLRDAFNRAVKGLYHGRSFVHHYFGIVMVTIFIVWLYFVFRNLFWILGLGYYSHLFFDYAHLNFLRIKGKITIKEAGFVEKISKFEILLDIFLIIGIVLLV